MMNSMMARLRSVSEPSLRLFMKKKTLEASSIRVPIVIFLIIAPSCLTDKVAFYKMLAHGCIAQVARALH